MSGTEDSILNNIPDFQQETEGGDTGGGDTSQGGSTQTEGGGGGQTSAQPTQSGQPSGGTQQPTQQPFRRRHDGLIEQPNPNNPNTRDLVDPVSGKVVAQGGIERRVFEEGQRHARENTQLKTQLQQATQALSGINQVTQEAVRLNVAPADQVTAIRVMADFMRDPVRTLQLLVEEVKAKGYQIPFLTEGVSPGMDLNAISRMIDGKLQPITQQHQQTLQQQRIREQSTQELNNFLSENDEANANLDVLSEMLQAQPSLSLHGAYTRMIRWAHEQGLDWTQPLRPQIAARNNGGQQPTHQQPTQQPSRPLPGRSARGNGAQPVQQEQGGTQFNENASWADIIRSAMQENNVRFN